MTRKHVSFRRRLAGLAAGSLLLGSGTAGGAPIDLADVPVFYIQGVDPNLVLTIDDSQSMAAAYLPDSKKLDGDGDDLVDSLRAKSSDFNRIHYDPGVVYSPPFYEDTQLPDILFNAACLNPYRFYDPAINFVTCAGCLVDLSDEYRSPWDDSPWDPDLGAGDVAYFCDRYSYRSGRDPQRDKADCDNPVVDSLGEPVLGVPAASFPVGCETSAFYYVYAGSDSPYNLAPYSLGLVPDDIDPFGLMASQGYTGCNDNDSPENEFCYTRIDVGGAGDVTLLQALHSGLPIDGDWARQNFANWYSYYRNRLLAAKAAVSLVMAGVEEDVRVGYQGLVPTDAEPNGELRGVQAFTGQQRTDFFDWLFNRPDADPDGLWFDKEKKTLVDSSVRVGEYFSEANVHGAPSLFPYRDDPTDGSTRVDECRRNYHLLFSDGVWDHVSSPAPQAASQNWDDTNVASPDPNVTDYAPVSPFVDGNTGGLADVAFYYWAHDLQPDDANYANNILPIVRERRDLPESGSPSGNGTLDAEDIYRNPRNNPATWQHLVTYTVGFGIDGNLLYDDAAGPFPDLIFLGDAWTDPNWQIDVPAGEVPSPREPASLRVPPSVFDPVTHPASIDDLWHAAINGRGAYYYSLLDTAALTAADESILDDIGAAQQRGGVASAAVTAGSLNASSKVFIAGFDSTYWTGEVTAFDISLGPFAGQCTTVPRGEPCPVPAWTATTAPNGVDALDPDIDRKITTFRGGTGIPFRWDSLSLLQKLDLRLSGEFSFTLAEARVPYLRGSHDLEQRNGGTFRDRETTVLGDVVNSGPLFVGPPNRFFTEADYRSFVTNNSGRAETVYVGANDGMLHAFDADTGAERFAYVPGLVFDHLADLTKPDYVHQFFVDGPLNEGDVELGSSCADGAGPWCSILVGALGKGAQGLFALDITDPAPADEAEAADIPLWEVSDATDADIGYIYGKPAIVRVCSARGEGGCTRTNWVVVTGNGYNNSSRETGESMATVSDTGNAVLFVLDAANGGVMPNGELDTGVGHVESPNGLAEPTVVDADGDLFADFAYAGDLLGNVWKFNLNDLSALPLKLFTAQDASGSGQPITTPVEVMRHPTGEGVLVLFGTGRLLGGDDLSDTQTQTYYGIWDLNSALGNAQTRRDSGTLLEQSFLYDDLTATDSGGNVVSLARVSTNNQIDWSTDVGWFIDLEGAEGEQLGERVVFPSGLREGRIVFVSVIPSAAVDPCLPGGVSWVNALDAKDGSRLGVSPFDFDLDGAFSSADLFTVTIGEQNVSAAGSSIRLKASEQSVYSSPASIVIEGGETIGYLSTSEGDLVTLRESSALDWRVWQPLQ